MRGTRTRHRSLEAGIGIKVTAGNYGTLTGLATRNSDGKKVLVTNLHSIAVDGEWERIDGSEELH